MAETKNNLQPEDVVQYSTLLEQLHDPCVVFDLSSGEPSIVEVNTEFRRVFSPNGRDLYGESLNDLIVPEAEREQAAKLDQRTVNGDVNEEIIRRQTTAGVRKFLYRGVPVSDIRGFGMYINITDRIHRQEYLDVLQRLFRHDLRNELNVILGNIRAAHSQIKDKQLKEHLSTATNAAKKLNQLGSEVQTVRKIIASREDGISQREYDLKPLIDDVASEVEQNFDPGEVTVHCDPKLTAVVGGKLSEALRALIDNGLRYNESDQPIVTVRCVEHPKNAVGIVISDNGVGISTAEKRVINSAQVSPLEHGSGLGLWIARWIIEMYDGEMEIKTPKTNKIGTVVYIRMHT